jgi:hypothetical protein
VKAKLIGEVEMRVDFETSFGCKSEQKLVCFSAVFFKNAFGWRNANIRGSIVVSIPACHAGDPGSIPGLGDFLILLLKEQCDVLIRARQDPCASCKRL